MIQAISPHVLADSNNGVGVLCKSKLCKELEKLDELYGDGSKHSWQPLVHVYVNRIVTAFALLRGYSSVGSLWGDLMEAVYGKVPSPRGTGKFNFSVGGTSSPGNRYFARQLKGLLLGRTIDNMDAFVGTVNDALIEHYNFPQDFHFIDDIKEKAMTNSREKWLKRIESKTSDVDAQGLRLFDVNHLGLMRALVAESSLSPQIKKIGGARFFLCGTSRLLTNDVLLPDRHLRAGSTAKDSSLRIDISMSRKRLIDEGLMYAEGASSHRTIWVTMPDTFLIELGGIEGESLAIELEKPENAQVLERLTEKHKRKLKSESEPEHESEKSVVSEESLVNLPQSVLSTESISEVEAVISLLEGQMSGKRRLEHKLRLAEESLQNAKANFASVMAEYSGYKVPSGVERNLRIARFVLDELKGSSK